jgi:hypothetical protein
MKHVKVLWLHGSDENPVVYLSELGADRYEVRKVQLWRDGRSEWADESHESDTVGLSEIAFPALDEISSQDEFEAQEISADEFESAWLRARGS